MDIAFRSCLTVGVATVTAAAIAFVPSVEEPAPAAAPPHVVHVASSPIQLLAQVQPSVTATALPNLLVDWLRRIAVPPSAGQPVPTPQFPPVVTPTSIGSSIKNVYNAVEPWVQWGFDLAAYAVGWIPYVGWLAPQISIFYNFGEQIVRSITFNVADWLDRQVSFGQGLVNVGVDTVNAFIYLANAQLAFWLPPLPPIPPPPPINLPFSATRATAEVAAAGVAEDVTATDTTQVEEKHVAVKGHRPAEVLAEVATDAAGEVKQGVQTAAVEGQQTSNVDAVKQAKEPKEPKEPKTTSTSADVAAQGEVRCVSNGITSESTNASNDNKKADKGPSAKAATDATESSTESSATKDGTGSKHDAKGEKKDRTGKKKE